MLFRSINPIVASNPPAPPPATAAAVTESTEIPGIPVGHPPKAELAAATCKAAGGVRSRARCNKRVRQIVGPICKRIKIITECSDNSALGPASCMTHRLVLSQSLAV